MSKLTIKKNPPFCEKEVRILPEHFEEGIKFVLDNNCDGIFLDFRPESKNEGLIMDFNLFAQVPHLQSLLISPFLELNAKQPIEGLHALKQLKTLRWQQKQDFPIDFSNFPELETLFYKFSKKATNLNGLQALKKLEIAGLNTDDCSPISELRNLESLNCIQGKFTSLNGLQSLNKLNLLELRSLKNLTDISAIAALSNLEKLIFEKTAVADYSPLQQATSLKFLVLDKASSIDFVKEMPQLKYVGFAEVTDGNLNPLLELPALESVNFYPHKKHYTHTEKQINEILKSKVH